jgi:hypothetical protein
LVPRKRLRLEKIKAACVLADGNAAQENLLAAL